MTVRMIRDKVRDVEEGMGGCQRIARERLESAYSWDTVGDGKTDEFGIRDQVEYHKRQL